MKVKDFLLILLVAVCTVSGVLITAKYYSGRVKGYYSLEEDYRDLNDKHVMTLRTHEVEISDMEVAYAREDSLRNSYEIQLAEAKKTIEALGIKLKNAEKVTNFVSQVNDTFIVTLDTFNIDINGVDGYGSEDKWYYSGNYNDGYLDMIFDFMPKSSELMVMYTITDTVYVVESWTRKPKNNGEPAGKVFGWLRPWQLKTDVRSSNPNAVILNGGILKINNGKKRNRRLR